MYLPHQPTIQLIVGTVAAAISMPSWVLPGRAVSPTHVSIRRGLALGLGVAVGLSQGPA